jgi:hypothetical protein
VDLAQQMQSKLPVLPKRCGAHRASVEVGCGAARLTVAAKQGVNNPLPNSAPRLTARTVRPARFTRPAGRRQATATRYAPRGRHASTATGAAWRRRSRDTAARRFSRCEIWAIRSRTGGRIA